MHSPLGQCPISKKGYCDCSVSADLVCPSTSERKRQASANDSIGAKHADGHLSDMDRSAPALAQATRSAHNFRKKTIQIHPLRKRMAVPTMCRSNGVSRPESHTYPGRDGLLPETQVQETGYFSVGEQSPKPLFRPSDQEHDFVKMSEGF